MTNAKERATRLATDLNTRQHLIAQNESYYRGRQPMAFVPVEARQHIKLDRMVSNLCRLSVNSLVERLRIQGFTLNGNPNQQLHRDWLASDMDQWLAAALRESLALSTSYALVWAPRGDRQPRISVESAKQMIVRRDAATREIVEGVKVWREQPEGGDWHLVHYEGDVITRYRANGVDTLSGGDLVRVGETPNPLGVPPIAEFANTDEILGDGVSEMDDLKPLVDGLSKVLADMMVSSEFEARPRRWATGIEMQRDDEGNPVNPFPEGHRMMTAEEPDASFGQLAAANLAGFENATKVLVAQIMAVTSLPAHYLGALTNAPTSADGNRSAEASLAARSEAKQHIFGPAVERIGQLCQAIRTDSDPLSHHVGAVWADPATRSLAQEADAVVKLHADGLLPATYALKRLGYGDTEIRKIRDAWREEQLDKVVFEAPLRPTAPPAAGGVPESPARD